MQMNTAMEKTGMKLQDLNLHLSTQVQECKEEINNCRQEVEQQGQKLEDDCKKV